MNKIIITDSEQAISMQDIADFEKKYDIDLPENYKKFLLKYNGGYIDDEDHDFLCSFNSLKHGELTLEYTIDTFCITEKLLDKEYLPIANTHSDNPITLCLKEGENYGKIIIFYFDRDEEPDLAADSLEELLGVNSIDEL